MPGFSGPSWPLLLWCGLAASIGSAWLAGLGATLFRARENKRGAAPRLMNRPRASTLGSLLTGTLLFAPLYGLAFEFAGHADLAAGATLGAAHGLLATAWSLWAARRGDARIRPNPRAVLLHRSARTLGRVAWGAMLGFLYVVPPA